MAYKAIAINGKFPAGTVLYTCPMGATAKITLLCVHAPDFHTGTLHVGGVMWGNVCKYIEQIPANVLTLNGDITPGTEHQVYSNIRYLPNDTRSALHIPRSLVLSEGQTFELVGGAVDTYINAQIVEEL